TSSKLERQSVRAFSLAYSNMKAGIIDREGLRGIDNCLCYRQGDDLTRLRWVEKFQKGYFAAFYDGPVKHPHCIQLPALRRRGPLVLYFLCSKRVSVSMCLLQNGGWCFRSHSCRNFFRRSAFVI